MIRYAKDRKNITLQQQLLKLKEDILAKKPAHVVAIMLKATEELIQSGIAGRGLNKGSLAPDFLLPNAKGQMIKLSDLLVNGPVVLVFYRGVW